MDRAHYLLRFSSSSRFSTSDDDDNKPHGSGPLCRAGVASDGDGIGIEFMVIRGACVCMYIVRDVLLDTNIA